MRGWLALLCLAVGCASVDADLDAPDQVTLDGGKADGAAGELRVRAADLTLWMDVAARAEERDGRAVWILDGRTSRNLVAVSSFVPDDGFGRARVLSPRRFEVELDAQELNSLLSGLRLFVGLEVAGVDAGYTAALRLQPRFARFAGSPELRVATQLAPVFDGGLVYRGKVTSSLDGHLLVEDAEATATGARRWDVDFEFGALAVGRARFELGAARKDADVEMVIGELALTTEDPYATWPDDGACRAEVQACLDALPDGELDTERCGAYREVVRCNVRALAPGLELAPEDRTPFELVLEEAELTLPVWREVNLEHLVVVERSAVPSRGEQVARGYLGYAGVGQALWSAPARTELDETLAAWGLAGLVAAAAEVVGDPGFTIGRLEYEREGPDERRERVTQYLLHFAPAARLVVVTLVDAG